MIITHEDLKGNIETFLTTFAFWGVLKQENKMEEKENEDMKKED